MAVKYVWIGTVGRIQYNDTAEYVPAASFSGGAGRYSPDTTTFEAVRTDGQILVEEAPHQDDHVVRIQDLLTLTTSGRGREQNYGRYF